MVTGNGQGRHKANTLVVVVGVGEIQNHRMVQVGRGLWRASCPPTLLKQGHLEQIAPDHILATR